MQPLRIAQVAPLVARVPPPVEGGTERVVHDLVEALDARGHRVTLFAADGSITRASLAPMGPAQADDPGAPRSALAVRELAMLDAVRRRADEFDIVHCHTEFAHAAVLRELGPRLVATLHWRTDQADRQTLFARFPELRTIALSRSQAGPVPRASLAGIVPHGIGRDRYALVERPDGHCVFLGRMTDQKRPDRAVRIAADAGIDIVLGGDRDPGNPAYFEREVAPRLGERARYAGPVPESAKQDFLGRARALLFPIDWPEPFGLVMIEAMACGTPVVAWRRGSAAEVVDEGVTGFVVDSHEDAVRALRDACALDRGRVRERFEERFTSARMAAGHEAVYRRLIDAPPSASDARAERGAMLA